MGLARRDSGFSPQLAWKGMAATDAFCEPDNNKCFEFLIDYSGLSKSSCFVRRRLSLPSDVRVAEKPAGSGKPRSEAETRRSRRPVSEKPLELNQRNNYPISLYDSGGVTSLRWHLSSW